MGTRGPAKSPHLKMLSGGMTLVQPEGTAAAQVQPGMPEKPQAVKDDDALSQWWDDVVPGLYAAGLTSTADTASVVAMLQHLVMMHEAYKTVRAEGVSILINEEKPEHGTKKNPNEAVLRLESAAFLEYAKQLGMTWMARARTAIPKGDNENGNPFGSEAASG